MISGCCRREKGYEVAKDEEKRTETDGKDGGGGGDGHGGRGGDDDSTDVANYWRC